MINNFINLTDFNGLELVNMNHVIGVTDSKHDQMQKGFLSTLHIINGDKINVKESLRDIEHKIRLVDEL